MGVALRMRMNTPGKHDGQMGLWIDGKSVIRADGLVVRGYGGQGDHKVEGDGATFKGVHFQTFFGGHTESGRHLGTQRAWFVDDESCYWEIRCGEDSPELLIQGPNAAVGT